MPLNPVITYFTSHIIERNTAHRGVGGFSAEDLPAKVGGVPNVYSGYLHVADFAVCCLGAMRMTLPALRFRKLPADGPGARPSRLLDQI